MKILLLGKNGMLGSDLKLTLDDKPGIELVALGHKQLDITDKKAVYETVKDIKPELIINAAAATHVDKCEEDPAWANLLNADAVGYLAAAATKQKAALIHFSTDYVFDGQNPDGYAEDDKPNPISVYGRSKLKGEENALAECDQTTIFRICWLFGRARKNFVDFLVEMAEKGAEVTLIKDQYGHPSYTKDLARAIGNHLSLPPTKEFRQKKEIYHLFNTGQTSRLEQGKFVFAQLGKTPTIHEVSVKDFSGKAPRPMYSILKNTKLPPLKIWQEATIDYLTNTD